MSGDRAALEIFMAQCEKLAAMADEFGIKEGPDR
jgi:hypothetical protein